MLQQGVPSGLDTTTIGLHQVTGFPIGTGVIIPCTLSLSKQTLNLVL